MQHKDKTWRSLTHGEANSVRSFIRLMRAIGIRHGFLMVDVSRTDGPYPIQYELFARFTMSERR